MVLRNAGKALTQKKKPTGTHTNSESIKIYSDCTKT